MTWAKLDDGFWSHPKVIAAGNDAAGAFARMLSYCGNQMSEGKVPNDIAKFIAKPATLRKLQEFSFIVENGQGYVIPDFLEFNPTRAEALALKATRAEAGRRGGLKSGRTRRANAKANGKANA